MATISLPTVRFGFTFFLKFFLFKALEIIPSAADIWCSEVGAHLFAPVTPFILLNSPRWQKAKKKKTLSVDLAKKKEKNGKSK